MINLIPNNEKKEMVRDFYFRFTVVVCFMLGISSFIASIALLPSYYFSMVKKRFAEESLELQRNTPLPPLDLETQVTISDLNKKLGVLEVARSKKFVVSRRVINEVVLEKDSDIKITQMSYDINKEGQKIISVRGLAPSRDHLLRFRRALEDNTAFSKVDLPISNFVKGSNILFSLTLYPS